MCGLDRCLIAQRSGLKLMDQRLLLVERLLGNTVVRRQQAIAFQIDLGDVQLCLALSQLSLSLSQRRTNRTVIDGRQQVAGFDLLTFLDQQFGQDAIDLGANDDTVQREHGADAGDVARYILLDHADDPDRNRRRRRHFCRGRTGQAPTGERDEHNDGAGGDCGSDLFTHAGKAPGKSKGRTGMRGGAWCRLSSSSVSAPSL